MSYGRPVQNRLQSVEKIVRIIHLVAIPIVVAVIGVIIQNSVAKMETQQEYVKLAIQLLTMPVDQLDPGLRAWAVDVLQKNSPVPLSRELIQRLKSGEIILDKIKSFESINGSACPYICKEGDIRWLDDYHYQICGNYDTDPCLEWSDPIYTPEGRPLNGAP